MLFTRPVFISAVLCTRRVSLRRHDVDFARLTVTLVLRLVFLTDEAKRVEKTRSRAKLAEDLGFLIGRI